MAARKLYELTPEHRAQLKPWADRWIANALNCDPMTDSDRTHMIAAVEGLYGAAGLASPRVIFCASPIGAAIAATIASGARWLRANPDRQRALLGVVATERQLMAAVGEACRRAVAVGLDAVALRPRDATEAATGDATDAATRDATEAATDAATRDATGAATYAATEAATGDATYAATRAATDAATEAATDAATRDATGAATVRILLGCCQWWFRFSNGGNMWSGWAAYMSFFRHVAHLQLPVYDKWQHYEAAAVHGGPRMMHRDFCVVSDRPELIKRDSRNRPHCADGPALRWRDGWELYYWHGLRVSPEVIQGRFTAADIDTEPNAEIRRAMVERYTAERYLRETQAQLVSQDEYGKLWRKPQRDDEDLVMVEVLNSTPEPDGSTKTYWLRVPPTVRTPRGAIAWTFGIDKAADYAPAIET